MFFSHRAFALYALCDALQIREIESLLTMEMVRYLVAKIGIELFQNVAIARRHAIGDMMQMHLDMRQSFAQVIVVRCHKIGHQWAHVHGSQFLDGRTVVVEGVQVAEQQQKIDWHLVRLTDFLNRLVAKAQGNIESGQQQNQRMVGGYDICQFHSRRKTGHRVDIE